MTSIRLHLINGAGQLGSKLVIRNEYDTIAKAVAWLIRVAQEMQPWHMTLVVIHGETNVIMCEEMPVASDETYDEIHEGLMNDISVKWEEAGS